MTSTAQDNEAPARGPASLAKRCLDIGYFTNRPRAMLDFWQQQLGLTCEPPVPFNDGLVQYRHALGASVLKINTAAGGVAEQVPCGWRELLIASAGVDAPRALTDPDGNGIQLVPRGYLGIEGIGLRLAVRDISRARHFYGDILALPALGRDVYAAGDSRLFIEEDAHAAPAGHWVNAGLRYVTLHVRRVDAAYAAFVAAGAAPGEAPYSIGHIARISFVRDPDGNWIEVAQRAALAGPWWDDNEAE